MKYLLALPLALALLVGCSPATPDLTPQQSAVTAYLKKTLDDPASYQPARWSAARDWQQKDVDKLAANVATAKAGAELAEAEKVMKYTTPEAKHFFADKMAEAKRLRVQADSLRHSANTTSLGQVLTHAYRAKNKMGGLVLDSAEYVIYTNGKVEQISIQAL